MAHNTTLSMQYNAFGLHWAGPTRRIGMRDCGPSVIENLGTVFFSFQNRMHLGPSVIYPTGRIMYRDIHGGLHRTNGPAVICADGRKEYWVDNGVLASDEFFLKYGVL